MKTNSDELMVFHRLLTQESPKDYQPHYFRCKQDGKDPIEGVSWKKARLTIDEALDWMVKGGNIGIAGMPEDPLTIVDQDKGVKPWEIETLKARSRSRVGIHNFVFSWPKIPNIPTDDMGEVRSIGQYVIAPGSFVPTELEKTSEDQRQYAGQYTVEYLASPAWVTYADLPEYFREAHEKNKNQTIIEKPRTQAPTGRHSALFDLKAEDIVNHFGKPTDPHKRWGSIFHDSTTEANMSLSSQGLIHCYRHNVSHGALSSLVVLSGYMTCLEAGTPHGGGQSRIVGDDAAIFHAWLYAKTHGYIPANDPIPVRALHHIAKKHFGYEAKRGEQLPRDIYVQSLEIVERDY